MAMPPFENIFPGILSGRSRRACMPNLELLAFNAHNLQGHVTITTPPVRKFFRDAGTFPGSMHAKLEVRIFSHFGASC